MVNVRKSTKVYEYNSDVAKIEDKRKNEKCKWYIVTTKIKSVKDKFILVQYLCLYRYYKISIQNSS